MKRQTEFPLEIINVTLFPAVRPETKEIGNDIKNSWLIEFMYNKDELDISGTLRVETNTPLRSNLDVARGAILNRLNLNA